MKKAIISLSGGPDSATVLWQAANEYDEVLAVTFHYGATADKEVQVAKQLISQAIQAFGYLRIFHKIVDISFLKNVLKSSILEGSEVPTGNYEDDIDAAKTTIVPFRNGIMLSILAGIAKSEGYDTLLYGAHFSDGWLYPDCRVEFVEAMGKAIYEGTGAKVHLDAPFVSFTKSALFVAGDELGVPLSDTWSCYDGGEVHCGQCGSCIERQKAFASAEIEDQTEYAEPWSGVEESDL